MAKIDKALLVAVVVRRARSQGLSDHEARIEAETLVGHEWEDEDGQRVGYEHWVVIDEGAKTWPH